MKKLMLKIVYLKVISLVVLIEFAIMSTPIRAIENINHKYKASEEKVVYLTFDDGPIPGTTDRILEVLSKYNVKATFFVVGKEIIGREALLRKIYKEGHSIGLHTYTHKFSSIYKTDEAFIEEMDKTKELVNSILGCSPQAIRFPGGSDRMLSYNLLDKLHQKGYMVYDWNSNLGDGINPGISVQEIVNNSKKTKGDKKNLFILAHCNSNNKNTYKALPMIIEHYKNENYEFRAIDKTTGEYYYKIKKSLK